VDVTNYVLMETGQPLHAFDMAQLKGKQVIVRKAKKGEKIPLLDGTERELTETMMVIADTERAVALAGVMGGSNSQVTDGTTSILLESALFLPGSVRKTARALSISSDSSYRFERGVDPQGVRTALDRAADLIQQVAGGQAAPGIGVVETQVPQNPPVTYRPARSNHVLGLTLSNQAQIDILKNLGCEVQGDASSASLTVKCPSHRSDLRKEIDLIEEMARLSGYDKIPVTPPPVPSNLFPFQPMVPPGGLLGGGEFQFPAPRLRQETTLGRRFLGREGPRGRQPHRRGPKGPATHPPAFPLGQCPAEPLASTGNLEAL
jgi:phenylalanyl-tRNA synthetase beta chain